MPLTYARVLDHLRRDPFKNVVMLKTLTLYPEQVQVYWSRHESEFGVLVLLPTHVSLFDQRGYPQTRFVVLADATHPALFPFLLSHIPTGSNLVFKLIHCEFREFLQRSFQLKRVTAYTSYTTTSQERHSRYPKVLVSDDLSPEALELFMAQGHPPEQVREYFSVRDALSFELCQTKNPVAACFSFQNFEQIHEIGGVYTLPQERRKGYAYKVVSTALNEMERRDRIPRYVVREDNDASMRLADLLNLKPLVTMEHWLYTEN